MDNYDLHFAFVVVIGEMPFIQFLSAFFLKYYFSFLKLLVEDRLEYDILFESVLFYDDKDKSLGPFYLPELELYLQMTAG